MCGPRAAARVRSSKAADYAQFAGFPRGSLAGKTLFVSGASRGIGLAIALRAARDGANIIVAAKTAEAHPNLPGTIYTAAAEIEAAGGKALPIVVDIRNEASVRAAIEEGVKRFGGIDILVREHTKSGGEQRIDALSPPGSTHCWSPPHCPLDCALRVLR